MREDLIILSNTVVICNSCCCGNVKKGHNIVPIDFLKNAWEKYKLENDVKLNVSTCLGPCSMHNVSLLKTKEESIWVGKLSSKEHYESIINWALEVSQHGRGVELPQNLLSKVFDYDGDVIIDDIISNA